MPPKNPVPTATDLYNRWVQKGQIVPGSDLSSFNNTGIKTEDYEGYEGYVHPESGDINMRRAWGQGWGEQLGKTLGNFIPHVVGSVIENVGYLGALVTEWGDDRDYDNAIVQAGKAVKEWDPAGEIFREHPDQLTDFTDPAFDMNTISQVAESVLGFIIPGIGVAKTFLTVADKLATIGKGLKVARAVAQLGSAATMAYMEGAQIGHDVYKRSYEVQLQKALESGMEYSEAETTAKHIASQAAATTVQLNTIMNTVLNITMFGPMFRNVDRSVRRVFAPGQAAGMLEGEAAATYGSRLAGITAESGAVANALRARHGMGSLAGEAFQEGLEELNNNYVQKVGEAEGVEGKKASLLASLTDFESMFDEAMTEEGAFSFVLGALAGPATAIITQHAPTNRVDRFDDAGNPILKKDKAGDFIPDGNGGYKQQQMLVSTVTRDKMLRTKQFKDTKQAIVEDITNYEKMSKQMRDARDKGNHVLADSIFSEMTAMNQWGAVEKGVGQAWKNTFQQLAEADNTKDLGLEMKLQSDNLKQQAASLTGQEQVDMLKEATNLEQRATQLMGKTDAMSKGLAKDMNDNAYKEKATKVIATLDKYQKLYDQISDKYSVLDPEGNNGTIGYMFSLNADLIRAEELIKEQEADFEQLQRDTGLLPTTEEEQRLFGTSFTPEALADSQAQRMLDKVDSSRKSLARLQKDIDELRNALGNPTIAAPIIARMSKKYRVTGVTDSDSNLQERLEALGKNISMHSEAAQKAFDDAVSQYKGAFGESWTKWEAANPNGTLIQHAQEVADRVINSAGIRKDHWDTLQATKDNIDELKEGYEVNKLQVAEMNKIGNVQRLNAAIKKDRTDKVAAYEKKKKEDLVAMYRAQASAELAARLSAQQKLMIQRMASAQLRTMRTREVALTEELRLAVDALSKFNALQQLTGTGATAKTKVKGLTQQLDLLKLAMDKERAQLSIAGLTEEVVATPGAPAPAPASTLTAADRQKLMDEVNAIMDIWTRNTDQKRQDLIRNGMAPDAAATQIYNELMLTPEGQRVKEIEALLTVPPAPAATTTEIDFTQLSTNDAWVDMLQAAAFTYAQDSAITTPVLLGIIDRIATHYGLTLSKSTKNIALAELKKQATYITNLSKAGRLALVLKGYPQVVRDAAWRALEVAYEVNKLNGTDADFAVDMFGTEMTSVEADAIIALMYATYDETAEVERDAQFELVVPEETEPALYEAMAEAVVNNDPRFRLNHPTFEDVFNDEQGKYEIARLMDPALTPDAYRTTMLSSLIARGIRYTGSDRGPDTAVDEEPEGLTYNFTEDDFTEMANREDRVAPESHYQPQYKIIHAASAVAIKTVESTEGEGYSKFQYQNSLNQNMISDILDPAGLPAGTQVFLAPDTEYDGFINMTGAWADIVDNDGRVKQLRSAYKDFIGPDGKITDAMNVPIKIMIEKDGEMVTIGYLHRHAWITDSDPTVGGLRNVVETIQDGENEISNGKNQEEAISAMRNAIVDNYNARGVGVTTTIESKGPGTTLLNVVEKNVTIKPGTTQTKFKVERRKASKALVDPALEIGVFKNEALIVGGDNMMFTRPWVTSFKPKISNGTPFILLPNANGGVNAEPLMTEKIADKDIDLIMMVMGIAMSEASTRNDQALKNIETVSKHTDGRIDISTVAGLRLFIRQYYTYVNHQAGPYIFNINNEGVITVGTRNDGTVAYTWKPGQDPASGFEDMLRTILRSRQYAIQYANRQTGMTGINSSATFKSFTMANGKLRLSSHTNYNTYIKERSTTTARAEETDKGEFVYVANPVIQLSTYSILNPTVGPVVTPELVPEPTLSEVLETPSEEAVDLTPAADELLGEQIDTTLFNVQDMMDLIIADPTKNKLIAPGYLNLDTDDFLTASSDIFAKLQATHPNKFTEADLIEKMSEKPC